VSACQAAHLQPAGDTQKQSINKLAQRIGKTTLKFSPKNDPITLTASGDTADKVTFVRNLHDKAHDKINHFDRLRQQILNYAILVFSALLAFVMKTEDALLQILGCLGIAGVMAMFRSLDHRYHTSTHGFGGSMTIFNHVIAHLLNEPKEDVTFLQYHTPSEETVQRWSLQTKIYIVLGLSAFILGTVIGIRELMQR